MKLKHINFWCLWIIFLIGTILRFYQLGALPQSINRDEAALGYNAFALIETGKDEFSEAYPLTFKSFGDYKLPLYIYGSMPFVKVFGLSNFSIRLLSAVIGSISILTIYFLGIELFKKKSVGLIASGSLAISPWAVFYSRTAFETNLATGIFAISMLLFLKSREKPWLLIPASLSIVLSLFAYNNPYIVGPILILLLLVLNKAVFLQKNHRLKVLLAVIILLIGSYLAIQTVWGVNQAKSRITIFSNPDLREEFASYRGAHGKLGGDWLSSSFGNLVSKVVDNQYVFYLQILIKNILHNFSPQFLLSRDSRHIWSGIPGIGHFYIIDYFFLIFGIYFLFKKAKRFEKFFVLTWLVAGVMPSALTIDQAHPNRSLLAFFIIHILIAVGIYSAVGLVAKRWFKISVLIIYCWSLLFFIDRYFFHFAHEPGPGWYPNLKEVFWEINNTTHDRLVLTSPFEEVHIYYLFYSQYSPQTYQDSVVRTIDADGFYQVHSYGNVSVVNDRYQERTPLNDDGAVVVFGASDDSYFQQNSEFEKKFTSTKDLDFVYKIY